MEREASKRVQHPPVPDVEAVAAAAAAAEMFWPFPLCRCPPLLLPPPPVFGCTKEKSK